MLRLQVLFTLSWAHMLYRSAHGSLTVAQVAAGVAPFTVTAVGAHLLLSRPSAYRRHRGAILLAVRLADTMLQVRSLDGRPIDVPLTTVVTPGSAKVVRGEGMPMSKTGGKGDLRIKFEIAFPRQLSGEQKQQLHTILAGAT